MKTHKLKTWPQFFQRVKDGTKTFEIRKNDRGFFPGDRVILEEWDPETKQYTDEIPLVFEIGYIFTGDKFGIPSDVCVFSLIKTQESEG